MAVDLKKIQMQQEAQAAQIARMQMQLKANQNRNTEEDDDMAGRQNGGQGGGHFRTPPPMTRADGGRQATATPRPVNQGAQYQEEDPNAAMLEAIVQHAAERATNAVQQNLDAGQGVQNSVKKRMERLVEDYPALRQEDSDLVIQARKVYSRITQENPGLDDATKYELSVREAASLIGARPLSAPVEDLINSDFVMPVGRNPAMPTRSTKSRLTSAIVTNAKYMGINVDPNSVEGKKNLAELSEYSARFNADVNEDQFKYR